MIRTPYLLATVGLVLVGAWAPAFSSAPDPSVATSALGPAVSNSNGDASIILIEGSGNPGEGWVEFAPVGSGATGPSGGANDPALVRLPFSVLGHTKILINMNHAEWVYSVGQPTTVTNLSQQKGGEVHHELPPILISKGNGEGFLEYVGDDGQVINLPSREDYLFPQDGFRYIKLPAGSAVKLLD